jgi:hypothetical protein
LVDVDRHREHEEPVTQRGQQLAGPQKPEVTVAQRQHVRHYFSQNVYVARDLLIEISS